MACPHDRAEPRHRAFACGPAAAADRGDGLRPHQVCTRLAVDHGVDVATAVAVIAAMRVPGLRPRHG